MKKTIFTFLSILMLSISVMAQTAYTKKDIKKMKLDKGMYAVMTTTKGDILLHLEMKKAPLTVANFIGLAEGNFKNDTLNFDKPFYNGLKFHRVIPNFMIQGGDPAGTGSGGPGYKFWDEFDESLTHSGAGILSMANSGPGTNGSQFFITHKETPWLNGKHTIFGKVVVGQDIVNSIEQGDKIENIKIYRFGKAAKKFKATAVFAAKYKEVEEKEKIKKIEREKLAALRKEKMLKLSKMSMTEKQAQFKVSVLKKYPTAIQTSTGLMYVVEKEGDKINPKKGAEVEVHYTGFLFESGKKFDSSVDRGQTFKFPCGQKRVIAGWDEGIPLMSKGAKYKLIIPYWLGYGERGNGPIPAAADLIFDVELINF